MGKKVDFNKLLFTPEAGAVIIEVAGRLALFSNKEPEVSAEVEDNGDLIVKIVAKSRFGGTINGEIIIPTGHWAFAQ